jgi:hypothetical protein
MKKLHDFGLEELRKEREMLKKQLYEEKYGKKLLKH